jgi:hypothetical protein
VFPTPALKRMSAADVGRGQNTDQRSAEGWTSSCSFCRLMKYANCMRPVNCTQMRLVEIVPSPTVAELKSKIKAFLLDQWKGPKERLFVYYSGHGFTDFNPA